jgi:hypothetical protein
MVKNILFVFIFSVFSRKSVGAQKISEHVPENIVSTRRWWNLLHYDIHLRPDLVNQSISGTNALRFQVLTDDSVLLLDLQSPMSISVICMTVYCHSHLIA